jgi:hypothetical protein
MVIAMNYTYRISPGTLLPMVATLPFLRGDDPVTIEAVISGTTGDLHVEVSAIGLGASYLHSCQTFADAGAMAEAFIEELILEFSLEPIEARAGQTRYCPECGSASADSQTCDICRTAVAEIASSLGSVAIADLVRHNEAHAAKWAGLVVYAIRGGRVDDAGAYAVLAARHARRCARFQSAILLLAEKTAVASGGLTAARVAYLRRCGVVS